MTATPTAATPEELAACMRSYADNPASCYVPIHQVTLTEWARYVEAQAQHSEAQRAEIERLTKDVERLLSAAGRMSYHPDACPITGRPFFMVIDGKATYGGPFDSYTIPRREDDGSLTCEQYDHDRGGWVEDIGLWLHVVSEEDLAERDEKLATAEAALAASLERERLMREALIGAKNCMELALRHTDHGGIIHAMKEGVGLINAALQPQETADVR